MDMPEDLLIRILSHSGWRARQVCQRFRTCHDAGCSAVKLRWLSCQALINSMQRLPNLTSLKFLNGPETSIVQLTAFSMLHHLALHNFPRVTDLSPLRSMSQLASLSFCGGGSNQFIDISHLTACHQLTSLSLLRCGFDLAHVAGCDLLTSLSLNGCSGVHGFGSIAACSQLCVLTVKGSILSHEEMNRISNCTRLMSLGFVDCVISDVLFLSACTQLVRLDLSSCHEVDSIAPLGACAMLQRLSLADCTSVSDIRPLAHCVRLVSLRLSGCHRLMNVTPLAACILLQVLSLCDCDQIDDLNPLTACTRLVRLNLCGCRQIYDLTCLSSLRHLQQLACSGCHRIIDVSPLAVCAQLRRLDLSGCSDLADISTLASCQLLRCLNLQRCSKDIGIAPLAACDRLDALAVSFGLDVRGLDCGKVKVCQLSRLWRSCFEAYEEV